MKYDEKALRDFVQERNEALFSFDESKIREYAKKYCIPMPKYKIVFWAAVCKSICNITGAPDDVRKRAAEWLAYHGFSEEEVNCCITE